MGAPCTRDDEIPAVTVKVFTVTGRMNYQGHIVEYDLVCRSAFRKNPCAPIKYGDYPARWRGKKLEVLVESTKTVINRYDVRGERDID